MIKYAEDEKGSTITFFDAIVEPFCAFRLVEAIIVSDFVEIYSYKPFEPLKSEEQSV